MMRIGKSNGVTNRPLGPFCEFCRLVQGRVFGYKNLRIFPPYTHRSPRGVKVGEDFASIFATLFSSTPYTGQFSFLPKLVISAAPQAQTILSQVHD